MNVKSEEIRGRNLYVNPDKYLSQIFRTSKFTLVLKSLINGYDWFYNSYEKALMSIHFNKHTAEKIENIIERVIKEELPKMKDELTEQYRKDKENRAKPNENLNFVQERAGENKTFFKLVQAEKIEIVNTFKR